MLRWLGLGFAICILFVPAVVVAHTTVPTADGHYFITVGHLDESATTYTKTSLDLAVRANNGGQRGAEIPGVNATLQATLVSPAGDRLSLPLKVQSGSVGKYTFVQPYVFTAPGQYTLDLSGNINGTVVDFKMVQVGGPIPRLEDRFFPRAAPNLTDLDQRLARLEEARAEAKSDGPSSSHAAFALQGGAVAAATLLVAVVLRRRTR